MTDLIRVARCAVILIGLPILATKAQTGSDSWTAAVLGTQVNVIAQHLNPFSAKYSGPMSLTSTGDRSISHVYGVYAGARAMRFLDVYLDVEMARGKGISHASGLAAVTNGDVLRQGTADLGNGPYVARAFARYTLGISRPTRVGTPTASSRVGFIRGGRFALAVSRCRRRPMETNSTPICAAPMQRTLS